MKTWRDGTATVLTLVLLISILATSAQARLVRGPRHSGLQVPGSGNELVLEGGLAQPYGDLKDEFWTTDNGFEAGTGYELGLRYRHYLVPGWAVSPAFHYVRFGSYSGVVPDGEALGFEIQTSQYRYGLDLQSFLGTPGAPVRPYLTAGIGLGHNVYRDEVEFSGVFEESVNNPIFNAGVGAKIGALELSGAYYYNTFSTSKFTTGSERLDFNWSYAVFRVGFAFGRH